MSSVFHRQESLSRSWIKAGTSGLVFLVGLIDYYTGFNVSVTLFYLVPVSLGAWFAGRRTGIGLAAASALVWLVADILSRQVAQHPFVPVWNSVTLGMGFVLVAYLFGALRDENLGLERMVEQRTRSLQAEIASQIRSQQQLAETNQELNLARQRLQRSLADLGTAHVDLQRTQSQLIEAAKMESVGRLAAGVAHEVKNPLMTLSLGADYFLGRPAGNPEEALLVRDMKEAVQRASSIINLLLDYSRPRPLEQAPEDLNHLIDNSLALVRHQLQKAKVKVVRELEAELPPVSVDRTRIEHVFVNLFQNACQAMPQGGTLTLRTSHAARPEKDGGGTPRVRVEIEDTGRGIAAQDLPHVFDPFFTTREPGQGTGLGLAIVRRIMETHGGSISLANRAEGGVRATLELNTMTQP